MMVDGQPFDDDNNEGLRHVIRLEKMSENENISDLDVQHVVHGGPFRGVIIRPPLNGWQDALHCNYITITLQKQHEHHVLCSLRTEVNR